MRDGSGERGRLYTYRYIVTTGMTSALKWAAMRAILMFHNREGQSDKTVSTDHNLWSERRAEANSNRDPSAYQPNGFPLGQTGSQERIQNGYRNKSQHRKLTLEKKWNSTAYLNRNRSRDLSITSPCSALPLSYPRSSHCQWKSYFPQIQIKTVLRAEMPAYMHCMKSGQCNWQWKLRQDA